jgi:hypothetical protein
MCRVKPIHPRVTPNIPVNYRVNHTQRYDTHKVIKTDQNTPNIPANFRVNHTRLLLSSTWERPTASSSLHLYGLLYGLGCTPLLLYFVRHVRVPQSHPVSCKQLDEDCCFEMLPDMILSSNSQ